MFVTPLQPQWLKFQPCTLPVPYLLDIIVAPYRFSLLHCCCGLVQEEFNRKRGLFDDDLAFIREVKEQETAAAGMDPDTELQTLHKRFSNWKHEFKVTCLPLYVSSHVICEYMLTFTTRIQHALLLLCQL